MNMTGMSAVASSFFSWLQVSIPSICGIIVSRSTRFGGCHPQSISVVFHSSFQSARRSLKNITSLKTYYFSIRSFVLKLTMLPATPDPTPNFIHLLEEIFRIFKPFLVHRTSLREKTYNESELPTHTLSLLW